MRNKLDRKKFIKNRLKSERKENLHLSFSDKVIIPKNKKTTIFEKIIKLFVKFAFWISVAKKYRLNKNKNEELINRTYEKISSKEFGFLPSSTAFHFLIAFVPITSMVYLLLSFIPGGFHTAFFEDVLGRIIPGIQNVLEIGTSPDALGAGKLTAFILIFLSSLWLASGGFAKFVYTENYIYDHKSMGNFFTNRFRGLLIVISITIYIFIASLTFLAFIKVINLGKSYTYTKIVITYIILAIWIIVTVALGITLLFKLSPRFKLQWKQIAPGITITAVPTTIFVVVFGFSTSLIDYGKYGLIGSMLYLGLFIYFITYFLYLGIIANSSYLKTYFTIKTQDKIDLLRWFYKFKK